MPAAVPIIAAVAAGGFAAAAGVTVFGLSVAASGLLIGAANLALGFITSALSPKPKVPNLASFSQAASGRTTMVRQPIVPHKLVYGEVRVSGPLVFFASTESKKYHHLVVVLASHEVEAINTVYLNDIPVFNDHIDGAGAVTTGRYANKVRIKKHLGTAMQGADSDLVSEVTEWTTAHRLRGRAYLYVRIEFDKEVFPTGLPNVSATVKGKKVLDTRDSVTRWNPNAALAIHDHLLDTEYGRAAATDEIETSFTTASANSCDEFVGVEAVTHTVGAVDTTNDVLNVDKQRLLVQTGDKFQLTTDDTLPAGLSLLTDYFAIVYHEQEELEHSGATAAIQVASSYANALAGTVVDITDEGTGTHTLTKTGEPRYTCNGTVETDKKPNAIIQEMLTSMGGRVSFIGGTWRILSASYTAPTVSLDESDLISPIRVKTRASRRDRFNRVKGVYATPLAQGQPTDYPPVINATYLAADNNKAIWKELDLPYTSRPQSAQRLAKIELERMRQEIIVEADFKLSAYQVQAGDTVSFSNDRAGFSSKVFEVIGSDFDVGFDSKKNPFIFITLTLKETASGVFDFASATEETVIDLSPNTTLGNPFDVEPPTGLTIGEALYSTIDSSGVKAKAIISWTASVDGFVIEYLAEYKLATDSTWIELPKVETTTIEILDIVPGVYDVRVTAINTLGIKSDPTPTKTQEISGLAGVPSSVQNLTINAIGGLAVLRWDAIEELDVKIGGSIEIRHDQLTTGASLATSVTIGEAVGGGETVAVLPLKEGTYFARAIDTSGLKSPAASVSTKQATTVTFSNLSAISEHPAFSGTHSSTRVDSGELILVAATLVDAFADVDAIVDWDTEGGVTAEGTYTFANSFDFGSVVVKRLTSVLTAQILNVTDLIDSRTENIDDWGSVDGDATTEADARVFVRQTDDDPAGSPTWGSWELLESGEFEARAFQFKCVLTTTDSTYNIRVSELTINAEDGV